MDILSLLLKRTKYGIGPAIQDEWLKEEVSSGKDVIFIVLTENALNRAKANEDSIRILRGKYSLKAMFDLKNPYSNTNVHFYLYVFTKSKTHNILYGIYNKEIRQKNYTKEMISLAEELPEPYFSFLENIEKYLITEECPKDTDSYEFGYFASRLRDERCWNPNRYSKSVLKIREALTKENTVLLKDIAEIIQPHLVKDKVKACCRLVPSAWKYPLNINKLEEGVLTDCVLKKGDILISNNLDTYLVYDSFEKELHTSPFHYVIRPKSNKYSSEFLYLYLKSDIALTILRSESADFCMPRIRKESLSNLKIVEPDKDDSYYKKAFFTENFPINDIEEINKMLIELDSPKEEHKIEGILKSELVENLKVYKEEVKERIIEQDLNEINICFRNKAYKATLILVGSVLEAVLIDWLSELHGRNYFEEEYIDHNGRTGTLAIYIRDIKYLKRPSWIEEAEKAYTIKDKRNMVHAKLCLNSKEEINEELCRKVIGYLNDVLKTRNGKIRYRKVKDFLSNREE